MEESEFADHIKQLVSGEVEAPPEEEEEKEQVEQPAAEREAPPEAEEPQAEEETAEEEAEQLLAGRYKTVEELEKAVQEKEALITRQGNEVGELRRLVEEYHHSTQAELSQMKSAGFEPDEEWEEWADSEIQRGKETGEGDLSAIEAIVAAGAESGPDAANYVLARWYAIDPAAATAFQFQAMEMISTQTAEQEAAIVDASDNGVPAPEVVEQAWQAVGFRHADVLDYRDAMAEALADLPEPDKERWQQRIAANPQTGEDFVEYLYLQARTREAEKQLSDRDAATAQARRQKADREAAGDTVASATSSPPRSAPVPGVRGFDREAFRREAGLAPME